jgi:hypothetical protein
MYEAHKLYIKLIGSQFAYLQQHVEEEICFNTTNFITIEWPLYINTHL